MQQLKCIDSPVNVATILHGAYGDYIQQSMCLRHLHLNNPNLKFKIYFANRNRYNVFQALDYSFADKTALWTEIDNDEFDLFYQYQVFDPELRQDVIDKLSQKVKDKIDKQNNILPWQYLPKFFPPSPENLLPLSKYGHKLLKDEIESKGLDDNFFSKPTIGVVWRYRTPGGSIAPYMQPTSDSMLEKYSYVLKKLIDEYDCNVMVFGMKRKMEGIVKHILDNKFPEFGLDIPESHTRYVNGLNFVVNAHIASKANILLVHASGFSEYVYMMRNENIFLVDAPLVYMLKILKYRLPFFDHFNPTTFVRHWVRPHSTKRIYKWLRQSINNIEV